MNPYLITPSVELPTSNFDFVCENCHVANLNVCVTFVPTMRYEIDQGLLLRQFIMIAPGELLCINCQKPTGDRFWLFWKNHQKEIELQQIIDLQNDFPEPHHVFKLPQFYNPTNPTSPPGDI